MNLPIEAQSELEESSAGYRGWRVAFASSACVFVSFASLLVYTFGVFLKPLAAEFGWSRQAISSSFGLAALSVAACSPFIGILLDRFPARRIILPCITVFGCAFASLSLLTPHLWHLYAVFVVLGVVGNGTAHLAYSRAISTWFHERRGAAFALLMSGGAVGAMVLPVVAQSLINKFGWRTAFALLGAMVLVVGLPVGSQVRERSDAGFARGDSETGASVAEGLRSWMFWVIVVVLFAISLAQNGSIAHLAALLSDRGVPAANAALAVSVLGAATLLGRLSTGWLLDHYFAPRVSFCLLATAAAGTLLLSSARSASTGFLGAALIGLGMGGEADVTPYLIAKYFGLRSFSTLYGFTWTAYSLAGAIGPVIMGKAFDTSGTYEVLLSRLALLTAAAGLLMLMLPRYRRASTGANLMEPASAVVEPS
jgi:predicted MFS family arabinose efflux permease